LNVIAGLRPGDLDEEGTVQSIIGMAGTKSGHDKA
jgi:hypothetical protein